MSGKLIIEETNFNSGFDTESEEIEIQSGQYWKLKVHFNYPKDTLLLVNSLNIIDDILHSVELTPHPIKKTLSNNHRIMYDDFIEKFEFVPLDEALIIREKEIQEEQEKINEAREELLIGYVDKETGISASKLISNITKQDKSNIENLPMQIGGDIESYEQKALAIQQIAEKQRDFIQEKSAIISASSKNLASYYQEKGTQALASVDSTIKYVAKLNKGIQTLGLFTGQGVKITQLASGEQASYDEPLTFFQRKLYFDEESFFELNDGGADFNSMGEFIKELETNFSVINRMIPSPRGIVMVQYRRKDKQYFTQEEFKDSPMACSMMQSSMNTENKARFLFIRNGANVYKIDCEDFFEAERLFPTAVEMNDFFNKNNTRSMFDKFRGVDFEDGKINPTDLQYVEARDKHDAKAIFYKRVLIILSGIHSRDINIIGEFIGSEKYIGKWYNLNFQKDCCRFVHDDEDGLDFNLKNVHEWLKEKNKKAMSGSRILCLSASMMNTESSPSAVRYIDSDSRGHYSRNGGDVWYFKPTFRTSVNIAFEKNNSLFVRIDCEPTKWSSSSPKDINVELDKVRGFSSYIVLDDIKKDEIQLYLNSRKAREDYLDYAELLLEAKRIIELDEKNQEDFLMNFKEHIFNAYSNFNKDFVSSCIDESIRLYRATNNGKNLPKSCDEDYNLVVKKISKIIHSLLNADTISNEIKEAFKKEYQDKEVVKVVIKNTSEYYLYSKINSEFKIFESEHELFEVEQYKIQITKNKYSFSKLQNLYFEEYLNERALFDSKKYIPFINITYKGLGLFNHIKSMIEENIRIWDDIFNNGGIKLEDTKDLLKTYLTKNRNSKRSYKRVSLEFYVAMFGAKATKQSKDDSIFNINGETKSKAFIVVNYYTNDIADFIVKFGNDESFKYLYTELTKLRFLSVARDLEIMRMNSKERYSPKEEIKFSSTFVVRDFIFSFKEDVNKVPSKFGFLIDNYYPRASWNKHGFNHTSTSKENKVKTLNDYRNFYKKSLKEPRYKHAEYTEEFSEFEFEDIVINEHFE